VPYRSIDDPVKLRRVLEATLLLEADLDLSDALRHVLDEARAMTNARFGAIGVLDEQGTALSEFLTAGLDDDTEHQIGARPKGKGVLGTLISHPQPIRIASIDTHSDSYGFPPHHPPMKSFLGVPIRVRDAVFGNLYLTDKIGWSEFTEDDEALVGALAVAAGIAIENARLHEQVGRAAVFDDRDRLARELHDSIIQRLFGVGLTLQGVASSGISPSKERRITSAIADIDETIRQIRTTIYGLSLIDEGDTARAHILSLVDELRDTVSCPLVLTFVGTVDALIGRPILDQLLPTLREAVTNIERHAEASRATIQVSAEDGWCRLEITDDGVGFTPSRRSDGFGLTNMRRRADKLHGTFTVEPREDGGTVLTWSVPLSS
jgi:signal transduction histidine kinase